jgi:hypothetical protein
VKAPVLGDRRLGVSPGDRDETRPREISFAMIGAAKSGHDQEGFREPHEAPRNADGDVAVALARAAEGPQPREPGERLTKYKPVLG